MPTRKTTREPAIRSETVVSAADGVVARKVAEETVIMDARHGTYYGLDEIGSRIWTEMERPITVRMLCERVMAEYDVEPERCEMEVVRLLGELAGRGLVRIAVNEE